MVCCPIDVGGFVHTFAQAAIQSKIGAVLLREGHVGALHGAVPIEPKHMAGVWGLGICNFSNGWQQRFYGVVHPHVVGAPTGVGEKQNLLASLEHEFQRHGNQWQMQTRQMPHGALGHEAHQLTGLRPTVGHHGGNHLHAMRVNEQSLGVHDDLKLYFGRDLWPHLIGPAHHFFQMLDAKHLGF